MEQEREMLLKFTPCTTVGFKALITFSARAPLRTHVFTYCIASHIRRNSAKNKVRALDLK